jgi:hypothetical protein
MGRIALLWVALFMEALGTIFVWLDTVRLNARNPPAGITLGDPPGYSSWYFHSALFGFAILFLGILITGLALLLEHMEISRRSHRAP